MKRAYKKVTITQVRAAFKRGESFDGFLVGNKVNSSHFFAGWYLASSFKASNMDEFQKHRNAFDFYLEPELGKASAIYVFQDAIIA